MKRFKFRLERVQKLRERVRDRRRLALVEAQAYQRRIEGQIDQIETARQEEQQALRATLAAPALPMDRIIQAHAYQGVLQRYRAYLDQQMSQIQQVVETRRQELHSAEKDVRILEKLEERLHARYDHVLRTAETQLMDELAGVAAARKAEL